MQRRKAFTITEMLVAIALVIFVMAILAQAFGSGLETFRQLKAIGDMGERLRMASSIIRRDLAADHFEGRKRLSDPNFFAAGPPREGFFRLTHGGLRGYEGVDGDGNNSYRATAHSLHFTVRLQGNNRQDFFATQDPQGLFALSGAPNSRYQTIGLVTGQWAEVAYFLRSTGETANGTPIYSLYRRQLLIVPSQPAGPILNALWNQTESLLGICCHQDPNGFVHFNTTSDATIPQRRFGMSPSNQQGGYGGIATYYDNGGTTPAYPTMAETYSGPNALQHQAGDMLLTDVLSFEVLMLDPTYAPEFVDLYDPRLPQNSNPYYMGTTPGGKVFDTWSSLNDGTYDYTTWSVPNTQASIPYTNISIKAIKIILRVWDKSSQKARQVTLVQEM